MNRSRIADDFTAIRARLEELQRERARNRSDQDRGEPPERQRLQVDGREEPIRGSRIVPINSPRPRN